MEAVAWRCRECGAPNGDRVSCHECGEGVPATLPVRVVTSLRTIRSVSPVVTISEAEWEDVRPAQKELAPPGRKASLLERVSALLLALAGLAAAGVLAFFIAIVWIAFSR